MKSCEKKMVTKRLGYRERERERQRETEREKFRDGREGNDKGV